MTEQGDGGKQDPVEKWDKKTGGRSIKSHLMLSGDVGNDVSTGVLGEVVKKQVFIVKKKRPNKATGLHLRTVVLIYQFAYATM